MQQLNSTLFRPWAWSILLVAGIWASPASGQWSKQTVQLTLGWNAIYLQVEPDNPNCDAVFADWPVSSVSVYNMAQTSAQFAENPSEPLNIEPEFLSWSPGRPEGANSLATVIAGNAYLIFATAPATRVLTGRPTVPRIDWVTGTPATNIYNLVGFQSSGTTSFGSYLAGAGFNPSRFSIYSVSGTNSASPTFVALTGFSGLNSIPITSGKAYLIACDKVSSFSGPVKVYPAGSAGLSFSSTSSRQTLRLKNDSGTNLTVTLTLNNSEAAPSGVTLLRPSLLYFDYLTGWTNSIQPRTLHADEEWTLPLALDRTGMIPGQTYGAIMVCSDTAGGRVEIPVEAESSQPDPAHAMWPAGLWSGKATLNKVSQVLGSGAINQGAKAGGTLEFRLILHVATDGRCRLLQRVIIAGTEDTNSNWNAALYVNENLVPPALKTVRISSVAFGVKNNIVWDEPYGRFGNRLRFTYVIADDDPVNPFRHPYHPDHDGLSYDYKSKAPSGNNPTNYIGEIKPELFSISNTVSLVWDTTQSAGGGSVLWNPSEKVTGTIDFQVDGIRKEGPILMQGTFELKRISQVGTLSEE